jgi:xanthine dehydrogenase accessory factor
VREIIDDIDRWRERGEPVALATVVSTWGSAPRGVGAKMAVNARGEIAGSVSGGCVESAVVDAALSTLKEGQPRLLRFGVADDTAWEVGLSCGGTLEVFVEPLHGEAYTAIRSAVAVGRGSASTTVIRGPEGALGRKRWLTGERVSGSLGSPELDEKVAAEMQAAVAEGRSRRVELPGPEPSSLSSHSAPPPSAEAFVDVMPPPPTLVMIGGVHIAVALVPIARTLGYVTVVVDPRKVFGTAARFPEVDRLLHSWPDDALREIGLQPTTAVAVLTHDPKLDDPALQAALPSPAFYVGALGSKVTQARRRQRLQAAGLSDDHIARLHAPIGLDLGGRSPEEIAIAVMAQVVATRNHGPAA